MLNNKQRKLIIELRKENKSYREISEITGKAKENIKKWCQRNGFGGRRGTFDKNKSLKERTEEFKRKFEKQYPDYNYLSSYKGCDSPFKMKCKICGHVQERSASCIREGHHDVACNKCKLIKSTINRMAAIKNKKEKRIKEEYRIKVKTEIEKLKKISKNHRYYRSCSECGKGYFADRSNSVTCSNECQNHRNNRLKEIRRREQLKKNGKINYNISLEKLIKRDNGICQLCGQPVNNNDCQMTDEGYFVAGKQYPSIDHIIPVSKGGTHTWDNVQLAHRHCNSIKKDESVYEIKNNKIKIVV